MHRLIEHIKAVPAQVPTAGAIAVTTPVEVDARGFTKALFVFETGAAAAGATIDWKVQKSATSGGALADVTGAALTQLTAAASASKVMLIDVTVDPDKPYMKLTGEVKVGTFANSAACILYNGSLTYPNAASSTESINA